MRWLILLFILAGCGGYRYTQQDNPLSQYGIKSLSLPMFHNYSSLPDVSNSFTRETFRLLTGYSGLKIMNGYNPDADAVMIGIVKSREKLNETLRPGNIRTAQEHASRAIGDKREKFYIPGTTNINLALQIIVIKKPTEEEMALLKSGIGDQIKLTSKVIFNETLPLTAQFTREVFDVEGMAVTATQNQGAQRRTVRSLAEQAALSIRDMIFYAF